MAADTAAVAMCMDAVRVGGCGLVAAGALILAGTFGPGRCFEVAGLGTIVPGSIVRIGPSEYRLTLEHPLALDRAWPSGEKIEVVLFGELRDTVCDRTYVYVSGTRAVNAIAADTVAAVPGKYDGCFQWRCHPDAYDACHGSVLFK